MDLYVVIVDRDDKKVKEYSLEFKKMEVLAGSGVSGVKDGSERTLCFGTSGFCVL